MKNFTTLLLLLFFLPGVLTAQVSISLDNTATDPSAMLDVQSNSKGFLPPRMTTAQIQAIENPAAGLTVFNTTTQCLNFYNGTNWMALCGTVIPQPPVSSGDILFAPYVDCCLWPNFQISNTAQTGIYHYSCAFIVDDQTAAGANPCWGGFPTLGMDYYQAEIASLRSQGGDIIMSFGGANGIELSYAAADEFAARDAYKTVINAYNLTSIDFDIEGMFVAHPASVTRRSKAMKLLQNEYPLLKISITLPVMPTGLTADGLNVVQSAITEGVNIHCVNVMAMDYGPSVIDMGAAAISAGEATFLQVKTLYQNAGQTLPDSVIWKKIGVTPMIGQNDVPGEIFYLDDATDLANWAVQKNIGRLAMWSANRDKQCDSPGDPLYSCSHITQQPFEFAGILGGVSQSSPVPELKKRGTYQQVPVNH